MPKALIERYCNQFYPNNLPELLNVLKTCRAELEKRIDDKINDIHHDFKDADTAYFTTEV